MLHYITLHYLMLHYVNVHCVAKKYYSLDVLVLHMTVL